MVERVGTMCEKQQLVGVFALCQSGLNMACFWHFLPSLTHTHTLSLAQFRQRIKNIATFTLFLHKNCSALSCQSRVKTGLFLPYFNTRAVITSWHHISLSQNTTFTLYYSNRNTVAHVFDTVDCMTFKKKRKKMKNWPVAVLLRAVRDATAATEAELSLRSSQTFIRTRHTSQSGSASSVNTSCDIYSLLTKGKTDYWKGLPGTRWRAKCIKGASKTAL